VREPFVNRDGEKNYGSFEYEEEAGTGTGNREKHTNRGLNFNALISDVPLSTSFTFVN
jgi:hypothetical protein